MTGQGAQADVVQIEQSVCARGDEKFWQNSLNGKPGTDALVKQVQGKCVQSEQGKSDMEGMCGRQAFLAAMDSDKSERKGMKKGGAAEVDGQSALMLEKKQSNGEKNTMYVATEAEPYVLRTVTEGGDAPGEVVLSDFNKKVEAQKPAAEDVVDPKKITA